MGFKENLRRYREKAGYKQAKEFAEKLGIPYSTYAGYEIKDREPKYELLCKIADLLDVSLDELLGRNDKYIKNDIIPKNDDDKLKIVIDNLLLPITKEQKYFIRVDSVNNEDITFVLSKNDIDFFITTTKKSIIDNINFINELTNNTKKKIFQKTINDNLVRTVRNMIIHGAPVNKTTTQILMTILDLQNELEKNKSIQDYEENKSLFPKIRLKKLYIK